MPGFASSIHSAIPVPEAAGKIQKFPPIRHPFMPSMPMGSTNANAGGTAGGIDPMQSKIFGSAGPGQISPFGR